MEKKSLLIEIGYKLRKVREAFKLKYSELAVNIGSGKASYTRYEQGKTPPKLITLYELSEKYNVSLDWLIRNKGEMFYKEKEEIEPVKEIIEVPVPPSEPTLNSLPVDIRELLDYMERIPLLRYEILTYFLKFKDKNKDLVANAFNTREKEEKEIS